MKIDQFDAAHYVQMIIDDAKESNSQKSAATTATKAGELPPLIKSIGTGVVNFGALPGLPSFGANYLAAIGDIASKNRQQSAQQRAVLTDTIVQEIKDQAAEMRSKAQQQLVLGVVSGALSIAQGVTSFTVAGNYMKKMAGTTDPDALKNLEGNMQRTQSLIQGTGTGVVGAVQSGGQYVGTMSDARVKEMDANIEQKRAMQDSLKALEESLNEVIRKAVANMDAIQQNMNQTRAKILG